MISSKRMAHRAMMQLFEMIKADLLGETVVFKSYSQMELTDTSRQTYHRKLQRFERHGLIKKTKTAHGHVFVITQKAKFLRRKAVTKKSRTDGNSTLVIFDIPEEKHNARDTLRRYLVRSGYTQMQKSSFLSPFLISEDLKDLIRELGLEKNILIFSAKIDRMVF